MAQKQLSKDYPSKTINEYLKLIETTPQNKRLHLKLGDLYLKNGENKKAINQYLKLADLYVEEDMNFRAISVYKKVLSIDPKLVDVFFKIGNLYLKEGLIGSARSYYKNILKIKPNDQDALEKLRRIDTYKHSPEVSQMVPSSEPMIPDSLNPPKENTIEVKPDISSPLATIASRSLSDKIEMLSSDKESEMHYHLGIAYQEMEVYDEAIAEFEMASSNPFIKFDCYVMMGSCFMGKGDYDQSINYYKKASEIKDLSKKDMAFLYYQLGIAYEAKGMISEARENFKNAILFYKDFPEAEEKLNKLQQLEAKDFEEKLKKFKQLKESKIT